MVLLTTGTSSPSPAGPFLSLNQSTSSSGGFGYIPTPVFFYNTPHTVKVGSPEESQFTPTPVRNSPAPVSPCRGPNPPVSRLLGVSRPPYVKCRDLPRVSRLHWPPSLQSKFFQGRGPLVRSLPPGSGFVLSSVIRRNTFRPPSEVPLGPSFHQDGSTFVSPLQGRGSSVPPTAVGLPVCPPEPEIRPQCLRPFVRPQVGVLHAFQDLPCGPQTRNLPQHRANPKTPSFHLPGV